MSKLSYQAVAEREEPILKRYCEKEGLDRSLLTDDECAELLAFAEEDYEQELHDAQSIRTWRMTPFTVFPPSASRVRRALAANGIPPVFAPLPNGSPRSHVAAAQRTRRSARVNT